ncbi:MAG: hypothetical protein RRY29_09445 [Desulfovibrionaceae bacterium]
MEATTTTIRLRQDTLERLDIAAESLNMTRTAVINKAVNQFLDYDAWFRAEVQKGIDADDAGQVVTTAEVKDRLRTRGLDIE